MRYCEAGHVLPPRKRICDICKRELRLNDRAEWARREKDEFRKALGPQPSVMTFTIKSTGKIKRFYSQPPRNLRR